MLNQTWNAVIDMVQAVVKVAQAFVEDVRDVGNGLGSVVTKPKK